MAKILLVDDDPEFNSSLKQCLEFSGHDVITAFDGKQGLELFQQEQPDVLITDIIMPEIDGLELILKLATKTETNDYAFPCKVIAISGGGRFAGDNYLDCADAIGVDAIIAKPLSLIELDNTIKSLLGNAA
ncbi:response regulator transcription factor [Litoribacillus peritrichatus]|uniref:Response regulatory domain-containing protein n=1 Tax=Litoribacillus peritrichatus TaxID=718191 RepID=A0ABP7M5E4_9GAMM